ncbi:hypothetical protein Poli38472_001521 [Pythium oligandrum]|uniref:WD repeat-containing protein 44 n=1 Tax=Pythium oligandrum TaxID=41045 RepID=A0A8K1CVC1_PYTOL|nr:hypothetical protein Poli38472_001521 [Pythium oligandrum]|eukprot:TMW69365.1 hypothetical protein Poli38472_001521 [Pythium oligandrum]
METAMATTLHERDGDGRGTRPALLHEDSTFMVDEDFYDAQEHVEGEAARQKDNENALRPVTPTSRDEPKTSEEEKYVVRNKDTGEEYDIRDLVQQPVETTIFPNNFAPPTSEDESRRAKQRRPSVSKLKIKFGIKGRGKEATKRNHVPMLSTKKDKRDFDDLCIAQSISKHTGTIWCMKFSHDGARLVSGGQDTILRVWKVAISSGVREAASGDGSEKVIIEPEPEQSYQGHTMPIVDVSWSRSNFILSASMDKTVRLWHISRDDCLHVFQHPDSVPAVDFHPKEDRYFLSGCFDNKARVWDIPEGCVVSYMHTPAMITAATFNPSGTRAVVGLLNGQCFLCQVSSQQQMTYFTQIECRNSRGPMKKGRKVTGIEFDPEGKYFLVSTNDSRMRLFSVDNYSRICKYKGLMNDHLQIKGRFSQDGDFVVCGSENGHVFLWNKNSSLALKSGKQNRNSSYEYFCAAEPPNGIVTVALFAPASTYAMVKSKLEVTDEMQTNPCTGLIVTASYDGCIKFFERSPKSQ